MTADMSGGEDERELGLTALPPARAVKWGASVGITEEDLAALAHDQFRYRETFADHLWQDMLRRVIVREDYAPNQIVLSPAVAAQVGVRGYDGRPARHDPSPALVSLLLTDHRTDPRKDRP